MKFRIGDKVFVSNLGSLEKYEGLGLIHDIRELEQGTLYVIRALEDKIGRYDTRIYRYKEGIRELFQDEFIRKYLNE